MEKISLTDLVDVISKSGVSKASKVKQIFEREDYHPAFDFYKKIRDSIVLFHKDNLSKKELIKLVSDVTEVKNKTSYTKILEQYISFLGRKKISWFNPPSVLYEKEKISVSINPELGLNINGKNYLIKLYFKSEPLVKQKIEIITHLMSICLIKKVPSNTIMSVLDIQNKKLISPTVPISGLTAMVDAELSYIVTIMESLK